MYRQKVAGMQKLIEVLVSLWLYDIDILSQWWVIVTVFPALLYFAFMIIKWTILTCPLWVVVLWATGNFKR